MPPGNSLESQFARSLPPKNSATRPVRKVSALLWLTVLVLTLALSAYAAHSRPESLLFLSVGVTHLYNLPNPWIRPSLCGSAGFLLFLLLRGVIRLVDIAIDSRRDRSRSGQPEPLTAEQFIESANELHVDPRIASEAFHLLASVLPVGASIRLNDDLRDQLKLSIPEIATLLAALPELCDRSRLPASTAGIITVYDLLTHVASAPPAKSGAFDTRSGAPMPVSPSASPHADLQNASPRDSRFRTRAHFSGVKRRASDYSGPFRRATDRQPTENYTGPLRRASDRTPSATLATESGNFDRRVLDRRSALPAHHPIAPATTEARQHRAVSADASPITLEIPGGASGGEHTLIPPPLPSESSATRRAIQSPRV